MLDTISVGDQDLLALAQFGLARIAAIHGNFLEARKLGEVSATTLEGMGNRTAPEVRNWLNTIRL